MRAKSRLAVVPACVAAGVLLSLFGCGLSKVDSREGTVKIDGSSTVMPISARVSEAYQEVAPDVQVPVGEAGTGSGMQKFIAGEIDICDASRPIKPQEIEELSEKGVEFIELPIALDGLAIVVNKDNRWATSITTSELRRIWAPDSQIHAWNEVRPEWPAKPLNLQGPGTNHGTYEYFADAIVKDKSKTTRQDYAQNQEYNTLVQGVSQDQNALGYVGYAYYEENLDNLKLLAVDSGHGPVLPSPATIQDGSYEPLSRPLFIYVSKASLARPEVKAFVQYYLDHASHLVGDAKYIPLPEETYALVQKRFKNMVSGSVFSDAPTSAKIDDLLSTK